MYLGVKCVIAKSIARIHCGNLINHGIVPLLFENPEDYDKVEQMDWLQIENFPDQIAAGEVTVIDKTKGISFKTKVNVSEAQKEVILDGGQLRHLQKQLIEEGILPAE
jgi:aconitate hydratase